VIASFRDVGTDDLFHGRDTRAARRICPVNIWNVARRKLDQLNAAVRLDSLRLPPGNQLEALRGDRIGEHSIRINDQYRVCFRWTELGPANVEVTDYH
jgi:proteic killer suppression protein